MIALSLSGYSPSEQSLWQKTCSYIRDQISDPYLHAIFTFLCSDGDFNTILVRRGGREGGREGRGGREGGREEERRGGRERGRKGRGGRGERERRRF